jgi:UDPglucose 6-dehydrogenase
MFQAFSAVVDLDDNANETSTAPTTPDGSLTFSPVLRPAQLLDAFEGIGSIQGRTARSSSATLDLDGTAPIVVRNICCVGAGYVGEFTK